MENSTKTNQATANQAALNDPDTNKTVLLNARNGKPRGICRSFLLAAALLGFLPTLQASEWAFNLIGKPSVQKTESEVHEVPEVFQMTGAGTFSPEAETASGQGTFAIFNGFEEPDVFFGGPTFRGTWKVTDFVGWTPDGGLQVLVTLTVKAGLNEATKEAGLVVPNILITISEEGINVDFGFELFSTNPTGSAAFHITKP